jgi:hypothetical protein
MVIERDRYLEDGKEWLVSLALKSRTAAAHSLLSALNEEERSRVSASLAQALDEIVRVLADKRARETGA